MISYYEHNKFQRLLKIEEVLKDNYDVAVITDAGTPAISDPAYKLVRRAIEIGSKIEAIPGASAVLAGLFIKPVVVTSPFGPIAIMLFSNVLNYIY